MKTFIIGNNIATKHLIGDLLFEEFGFTTEYLPYNNQLNTPAVRLIENADIVIVDFTTTKTNSRLLIMELRKISPKAKIIAMHYYLEKEFVIPFIQAGASAYLLINTSRGELLNAVNAIIAGNTYSTVLL